MTMSTLHSAQPEFEDELEGEYEGEEFDLGGVIRGLSGLLGEGEYEDELEDEYELEDEWEGEFEDEAEGMANPLRRVYQDAMMEHLGHAAAEAETEAEAEAFIGALVPLAAGLVRSAAPHVARSTPHLVRGLSSVARTLRRSPTTRPLVRALPTIASRTTRSLARQVARGHPITARRAVRTLAGQTAAVLSHPRRRHQVIHRARALDRRYHRAARDGQWRTWDVSTPSAGAVRTAASGPAAIGGLMPAGYRQVRRVPGGQPVPGRSYRRRGYPGPGRPYRPRLSIAWIPVPAWTGSQPPPGAYRY
jgi:hypothetical protein